MQSALRFLLLPGIFLAHIAFAEADAARAPLRVLTTIKPLQLLALAVGGDAIQADALLKPHISPHDYQLRPSDRAKLNDAQIIFWVGPELEVFLEPVLKALPKDKRIVSLHDGEPDPHIWMDPMAAIDIGRQMASVFTALQPARASEFSANADRLAKALTQQDGEHRAQLQGSGGMPGFMVSHDAYSRFERRYGLMHRAALTDAADLPPSAKSLMAIERDLADGSIACVWRQTQESKLYERVVRGKNIQTVTIDAMAEQIPIARGGSSAQNGVLAFYDRLWQAAISCLKG